MKERQTVRILENKLLYGGEDGRSKETGIGDHSQAKN